MLGWPCILNYVNNNQHDALFIFSLLNYRISTYFGRISSPSSGGRMYICGKYYLSYSAFGKALCTYKRCWKWCPRASIQACTRLILFANTFCRSAFGKSLCTYNRCWKWCPRASIQAWTRLILFTDPFCRSAFEKSLYTYTRCWKWCPRASIQAWTRLRTVA
jgi:hypothetical protein